MRRVQIWSKKAKTEHERLKQEIADRKTKARSESEDRRENIKRLSKECKGLPRRRDFDELLDELEKLNNKFGSSLSDRIRSLHQLAELQDREIEYLTQFRRDWEQIEAHYPGLLENLRTQSLFLELGLRSEGQSVEERPGKAWERKHGDYKWCGGVGLIEYEFGGAAEAKWYEWTHGLSATGEPYQPTCLDDIFAGGAVHMHNSEREAVFLGQPKPHRILQPGLQLLFGMHSNGFQKNLTSFTNRRNRRERLYDYRAVTEIMEALLKPREGKTSVRGGPRRLWPSDPDLRTPVLSRIEARINSLSVPEQIKPHIKAKFLAVVHRPPPDSAKK
jgi:hypothetical protein